jgi:hypothetical protein
MSHSNSHLRVNRGRPPTEVPPQRERGQRRPRSPEELPQPTAPRNSSPEPITLITKSPHSRRTIKKGKIDGDFHPVPLSTSHNHTSIEPTQTSDPSTEPPVSTKSTPTTIPPPARDDPHCAAKHLLGRMTAQLESVLRSTDTLIKFHLDINQLDTSSVKQVLNQLIERLDPGVTTQAAAHPSRNSDRIHPPTQKKSYAEATSTTTRPTGPPRSHRSTTGTKPTLTGTKPGPTRQTDFARIVVAFTGKDNVKQIPSVQIKDQLNGLYSSVKNTARVSGAQFSRNGNLVLSVTPAIAAKHVLSPKGASDTISLLRDSLGLNERVARTAKIYPADPWHRVVIHNIPLLHDVPGPKDSDWWDKNRDSIEANWRDDNPLSHAMPAHCMIASKFLFPDSFTADDLVRKGSVSWCIAFDNIKHARRLIQEGAFIHGSHCRVSPYRPMSRPKD